MRIKNERFFKTDNTKLFFSIAYVFFTALLFMGDLGTSSSNEILSTICTFMTYLFLGLGIIVSSINKKIILRAVIMLLVALLFFIRTHAFIIVILFLFGYLSIEVKNAYIINLCLGTVLFMTVFVLLLYSFGAIKDVLTSRWSDFDFRHSYGFYHSNVLPLITMYICVYLCLIYKERLNLIIMMALFSINELLYRTNNSRNAYIVTLLILIATIIHKIIKRKNSRSINKILNMLSRMALVVLIPTLEIISVIIPFMLNKSKILSKLDVIFSLRFSLIHEKIRGLGLEFIPRLRDVQYFKDGIPIDNGYAFLAIRYGIFMLVVVLIIVLAAVRYYKENYYVLSIIALVAIANFVVNDIIDYSCFPFLIIGIKNLLVGRDYKGLRIKV